MRLLDAWQDLPDDERAMRLRALRAACWMTLRPSEASAVSIASRCCEADVAGAWQALDEELTRLPSLSLRKLLCGLASADVRGRNA